MSREPNRQLERWLDAERRGKRREAEHALRALLGELPPVSVSGGFAGRVMDAADWLGAPTWWRRHAWLWRAAIVGWMVTAFAALAGTAALVVGVLKSGQAVGLATQAAVAMGRLLADLLVGADGLFRASRAVAEAFSGPTVLLFLLTCALAASISTRVLAVVISRERSLDHV